MRMLNDTHTMAVDASSYAPPPPHMPWGSSWTIGEDLQKAAGWSERDFDARIRSSLHILALGLVACLLCRILTFVLDGGCTENAPAPPPHVSAADVTATAAGDVWLKKRGRRRLPVVVYEAKPGASATDDCVICLGEFDDSDKVCVLPRCHHGFHVQCIDPWLVKHPSCPTCRDSLLI